MLDASDPEERGQYPPPKKKATGANYWKQTRISVIERGKLCRREAGMKSSRKEWAGI